MEFIKPFRIFESTNNKWVSTVPEVMDHFQSLKDCGCDINIFQYFISKDLSSYNIKNKPGYYPGFIVMVYPEFTTLDFDNYVDYIKEVSICNSRLPNYYDKYKLISEDPGSEQKPNKYKFTFLDTNWNSIIWDEDIVYIDRFMTNLPGFSPRYGQIKGGHRKLSDTSITLNYVQPVSKAKSDRNIASYKQILDDKMPDYDIEISDVEDISTNLVKSIIVTCKGKKK